MAHKKGAGSTDNGRDSRAQYLGVKMYGGQFASPGNIIVRQRGTKFHAGENVYMGKDFTLHASIAGIVTYKRTRDDKRIVFIQPAAPKTQGGAVDISILTAPAVIEAPVVEVKKPTKGDDLKKIEGIGPKIEQILHEGGITTFAQLADSDADQVKELLTAAGPRYAIHNPATWAKQAALAAAGKWDELKELRDQLDGGKE